MAIKINQRERYAVALAAAALLVFAFFQFFMFPFMEKQENRRRLIQLKTKTLAETYALRDEYRHLKGLAEQSNRLAAGREAGFTLFSFIDRLAGESGLKEKIVYMKPSVSKIPDSPYKRSLVEIKLQGVVLAQLGHLLYNVETSDKMITVKRLSINKAGKDEELLTAVIQVETLET